MAMIIAKKLLRQCSICRAEATQKTTTMGTSTTINHRTTHIPPMYIFHGREVFLLLIMTMNGHDHSKKIVVSVKRLQSRRPTITVTTQQ
jgi:hypothetical protein